MLKSFFKVNKCAPVWNQHKVLVNDTTTAANYSTIFSRDIKKKHHKGHSNQTSSGKSVTATTRPSTDLTKETELNIGTSKHSEPTSHIFSRDLKRKHHPKK